MDNLSELKTIWLSAKTDDLPGAAEILRTIRKYRFQKLVKLTGLIIIALVLIAILVRVVFVYKSAMLTTRIGEGLMILAGLMLLVIKTRSFVRFYRAKDCSNKDFILFLEQTRHRQLLYFKRTQVIALWVCSAGLLFYIFEPVYQTLLYSVVAYSLLTAYLLIMAFVVRPRIFKRKDEKLKTQIQYFQTLLKQIDQ